MKIQTKIRGGFQTLPSPSPDPYGDGSTPPPPPPPSTTRCG
ncbi:MAG TPA: hypothetical protein VGH20_16505 [Myxococcales bacterium]|jgi:hypothetical protein